MADMLSSLAEVQQAIMDVTKYLNEMRAILDEQERLEQFRELSSLRALAILKRDQNDRIREGRSLRK